MTNLTILFLARNALFCDVNRLKVPGVSYELLIKLGLKGLAEHYDSFLGPVTLS